jgi:hypothetical protein
MTRKETHETSNIYSYTVPKVLRLTVGTHDEVVGIAARGVLLWRPKKGRNKFKSFITKNRVRECITSFESQTVSHFVDAALPQWRLTSLSSSLSASTQWTTLKTHCFDAAALNIVEVVVEAAAVAAAVVVGDVVV